MNNDLLIKYLKYKENQQTNLKIADLNIILNKLEKSQTTLKKQKIKSCFVGLTSGFIFALILTILIFLNNGITLPLFICNIIMGFICGIASKILYYKETTKELRDLIKNNSIESVKQQINDLKGQKEKIQKIKKETKFTAIKKRSDKKYQLKQSKIYCLNKK